MVHFFEEIWRFKGLGLLWAILIALIITGMREASKRIENRNIVAGIFVLGIGCSVLISVLILNSSKAKTDDKITDDPDLRQDSVTIRSADTSTYVLVPDITTLTCEFMKGHWKVVSTDKDSSIKTTVEFNYQIFNEKVGSINLARKRVFVQTDEWRLKVQPTSEFNLYNFASQDENIKLKIKRADNRMKGELKLRYKVGIVEKKEELKTYELLFTKIY